MEELFDRIDLSLSDIFSYLKDREWNEATLAFEELREVYDMLRYQVERERKLTLVERQLYASPKSLGETLDHIANIIRNEFQFSRFDIVLVDHDLNRVMSRYSKGGFGEADLEKLKRHGALGKTHEYSMNNMNPWIVNDIKGQDPLWKLALELDCWVHGTFPLYHKAPGRNDELAGYLHGARTKKDFLAGRLLNDTEVKELKRLGWAITKAINEAKLTYFEHAVMKIQDVIGSTRIEISKAPEDFEEEKTQTQMDNVIDVMIRTLRAGMGGIFIREKEQFIPYSFRDDEQNSIPRDQIAITSRPLTGIFGRTIFSGYSVIENEVMRNNERMDLTIEGCKEPLHTLLSVPFIESYSDGGSVRKNVIGAIVLLNKKDGAQRVITTDHECNEGGFSSLDRRIIESISPHIETIISNTRSHRELKEMSITDGLTGLFNHAFFMNELLNLEFKRSERYGTPLSILLMDIDHFKTFNDIFGHQVGDLVIKEFAGVLRENTRSADHTARYGGEEFIVLLHNTNLEQARQYAEKIRNKVFEKNYVEIIQKKQLFDLFEACKRFQAIIDLDDNKIREAKLQVMKKQFNLDPEQVLKLRGEKKILAAEDMVLNSFRVTVSIGLAYYPNPIISSKKDLVTTADMLLLKAKENGRNRVEFKEL